MKFALNSHGPHRIAFFGDLLSFRLQVDPNFHQYSKYHTSNIKIKDFYKN